MQEINLYILTEQQGNTSGSGRVAYELESLFKGKPAGRTYSLYLSDRNKNGAMLEGLYDALENHVKDNMDIRMNVYTEAPLMNAQISNGNIYRWKERSFTKANGEPVLYAELWEPITELISTKLHHRISTFPNLPREKKYLLEQVIKKG